MIRSRRRRSLLLPLLVPTLCLQHLLTCFCMRRRRQILHSASVFDGACYSRNELMPALSEFPMIRVVQPAYHCLPKGGHGSFFPSGNLRLSCDRVFATSGRSGCVWWWGYFGLRTFGGVCYCCNLSQSAQARCNTSIGYIFLQLRLLRQLELSALRLATELSCCSVVSEELKVPFSSPWSP
jgi:hypothetical protein